MVELGATLEFATVSFKTATGGLHTTVEPGFNSGLNFVASPCRISLLLPAEQEVDTPDCWKFKGELIVDEHPLESNRVYIFDIFQFLGEVNVVVATIAYQYPLNQVIH